MIRTTQLLALAFALFPTLSCSKNNDSNSSSLPGQNSNDWLIPQSRVVDGGPGKDGIPAINDPQFISVNQANFLQDDDLVIGYRNGADIRAYPHNILNWHEIVNDNVSGHKLAVIYCPLTGTATGWNRILASGETTFGVSGLLYNTNVIPFDRRTNSNWSQLLQKSVNGQLIGTEAGQYQLIETSWKTWKNLFPDSRILSTNTGFSRNYATYPYRDYRTNHNALLFSILPDDERLNRKERVLAVTVKDETKVFRFSSMTNVNGIADDIIGGMLVTVIADETRNIMVAFEKKLPDGRIPVFSIDNSGTGLVSDQFGNSWDAFGYATSGPLKGQKLNKPVSIMGYWLAFGSFYPAVPIF